jgi:hypothetical protein
MPGLNWLDAHRYAGRMANDEDPPGPDDVVL